MHPIKFTVTRPSSYPDSNVGRAEEEILSRVEKFMQQFTHVDDGGKLHQRKPEAKAEEIFINHDAGINIAFMPTLAVEAAKIAAGEIKELPSRFSVTGWQLCVYRRNKVPTVHTHIYFRDGSFYLLKVERERGAEPVAA